MFQCLVFGPKLSPGWRFIVFFQKRSRLTSTFVYKVDSTHSINISIGVMWWFEKKYSNKSLTQRLCDNFYPEGMFSAGIFFGSDFCLQVFCFGSDFFRRYFFPQWFFSQNTIFGRDFFAGNFLQIFCRQGYFRQGFCLSVRK